MKCVFEKCKQSFTIFCFCVSKTFFEIEEFYLNLLSNSLNIWKILQKENKFVILYFGHHNFIVTSRSHCKRIQCFRNDLDT